MKHKHRKQNESSQSNPSQKRKHHKQISKQKHKNKKMKRAGSSQSSQSNEDSKRKKDRSPSPSKAKRQKPLKHQAFKRQQQGLEPKAKEASPQNWQSQEDNQMKRELQVKNRNENQHEEQQKKQQPNFEPSGILLQFYNARQGVSLKFHEPPQAHKPVDQWRIYPFKDGNPANPIILKSSCYLIGKDQRVCDILCENSSISRQHAVIQFRSQYKINIEGVYDMIVKPYIMDLGSTNGTTLNDEKLQPSRYYELLNKDALKFGLSERQYVMFKVNQLQ